MLFIIEADNLLDSLFLSPERYVLGDNLAQEARNEGFSECSLWGIRVIPLMVSAMMMLVTVCMDELLYPNYTFCRSGTHVPPVSFLFSFLPALTLIKHT